MILENHLKDEITYLPNTDGDVLCIHCGREDNIHRRGANPLIGCEPDNGLRLYIHAAELNGSNSTDFIEIYYRAHSVVMRGEVAH